MSLHRRIGPMLILVIGTQGCASLSIAAWELRREERPLPVRAAASLGDTVGFVAFAPVSVLLFPITVPAVHLFDLGDPYAVLFFPSLAAGDLLSVTLGGTVGLAVSPFVGSEGEVEGPRDAAAAPDQPRSSPSRGGRAKDR